MQKLEDIGGIDAIIELYVSTRSEEARGNLFTVIFDFLVSKQRVFEESVESMRLISDLLKYLGAPHYFYEIFIYPPSEFVENFTKFIYVDRFKKDAFLAPVEKILIKAHIVAILYEFEQLARAYCTGHPEFVTRLERTIKTESLTADLRAMKALLLPEQPVGPADRKNGELWLFGVIEHFKLCEPNRRYDSEIATAVENILSQLLHSKNPKERLSYLVIVNRLVFLKKAKLAKQWSEGELGNLFGVINERFTRFMTVQDMDEDNLLFMADVILRIASIPFPSPRTQDLDCDAFLAGEVSIPDYLLKGVNISVIHHVFMNLPAHWKNTKAALLVLIIEQCKSKIRLESIGGMNFFKSLLASREPQVAYHASRFIVEHLKAESPEKYKAMLDDLVSKAQETNDEKLLDNPYLQVREILKMFETYK